MRTLGRDEGVNKSKSDSGPMEALKVTTKQNIGLSQKLKSTLGVQIIVRRMIINFRIFSQPYFLIWDRMIINFEMNEIQSY